jgi:excisionase family DNA binding protein
VASHAASKLTLLIATGQEEPRRPVPHPEQLPHVAASGRPRRQNPGVPVDMDELRISRSAVVTVAQAASVFGVDVRTVSRAIENGELPSVRLGRRVLIPRLPLLAVLGVKVEGSVMEANDVSTGNR